MGGTIVELLANFCDQVQNLEQGSSVYIQSDPVFLSHKNFLSLNYIACDERTLSSELFLMWELTPN